jgi:hypothetical protein
VDGHSEKEGGRIEGIVEWEMVMPVSLFSTSSVVEDVAWG